MSRISTVVVSESSDSRLANDVVDNGAVDKVVDDDFSLWARC